MTRQHLLTTLPAALLSLALAAPAHAQSALTDPAPGLGGTPAATPEQAPLPAPLPEQAPASPIEQAPTEQFGATDLSATGIIRELAPIVGGNPGAPRRVQTPSGIVVTDASRAVDLTVFFAYDSDRLLPEARAQLDALGQALNDPQLLPYGFLIAGHTDAVGSAAYNVDLSVRRALSVANYLVQYHRIAPGRLVAHGWGEARLKLPSDPYSGANRRVEVSLLLPQQNGALAPGYRSENAAIYWQTASAHPDLVDPRWRLGWMDLDDFGATPTRPLR